MSGYYYFFELFQLYVETLFRQHNDTYAGIFDHLVSTCFGITEKIMPVVCNPSPEGYLPDNVEELCENDESPSAQKVLGTFTMTG